MTTPPSNMHPTMVVPVDVALGRGRPRECSVTLRAWLEKSKPGIFRNCKIESFRRWMDEEIDGSRWMEVEVEVEV